MKWTTRGKRGAWYVVSLGFMPVTAGDMGRGVSFARVHKTRRVARQFARVENEKESVSYAPIRSYI